MTQQVYSSELHEYIDNWVRARNTTWDTLFKDAGLYNSVGTKIRKGSVPRPDTLRKLAHAMGVSRRTIFEISGYLDPEDSEGVGLSPEEEQVLSVFRHIQRRVDRRKALALLQILTEPDDELE